MYCRFCGNELPEIPDPGEKKTKNNRVPLTIFQVISVILALALLLTFLIGKPFSSVQTAGGSSEDRYFKTPEDAIESFIEAVAGNNLSDALAACAIDVYSEKFDFTGYANRLKAIVPYAMAPSEYKLYLDVNKRYQEAKIASQIKCFAYSLLAEGDYNGQVTTVEEDSQVTDFVADVDSAKLEGLKIARMDPPSPDLLNSARNLKNFRAMAELNGGVEGTERVVLYKLNGEFYMGGFHLIRYDEGWKIEFMTSNLAGTSADGSAVKTAEADYLSYTE